MRARVLSTAFVVASGAAIALRAGFAFGHTVLIDGAAGEWSARAPAAGNLGLVARGAGGEGEYVWRDVPTDERTDLAAPDPELDLLAVQVTGARVGGEDGFAVLIRTSAPAGATAQFQLAIDLDRTAGAGQDWLAGWADTRVGEALRWEFLVQTRFASGGAAAVVDTAFADVRSVPAARGADGVEVFVPWAALSLSGAPSAPVRLGLAAFRSDAADRTVDIGGAGVSNAVDVLSDYGDPASSGYPNTWAEVGDQVVDRFADVWFRPAGDPHAGEVYAPLLVDRFVSDASAASGDEWVAVRNVGPASVDLSACRIGDEAEPDGTEGMYAFPAGRALAPGAVFVVAADGDAYARWFGEPPDAEFGDTDPSVPDMVPYGAWARGTWSLSNTGDEIVLLDHADTVLDAVTYGGGSYPGVAPLTPRPPTGSVAVRDPPEQDADDCDADFVDAGAACPDDAACGGAACSSCSLNACRRLAAGAPCGTCRTCDAAGGCTGTPADDPACGTIACRGLDTPCRAYSDLATDRCEGFGDCREADVADCTVFVDAAPGAECAAVACAGEVLHRADTCGSGASSGTCQDGGTVACTPYLCREAACAASCATDADCAPGNRCVGSACVGSAADGTACDIDPQCRSGWCVDGVCCNDACDGACESCALPGTAGSCTAVPPGTDPEAECGPCRACGSGRTCAAVADGTPCDLGPYCTVGSTCRRGACGGGAPRDCGDANPCTGDSCDETAGACRHEAAADGASCADDDLCNGDETCRSGVCTAGAPLECDDDDPCTIEACVAGGGCVSTGSAPDGTPCPDADRCNGDEACVAGVCGPGTPPVCDDDDPCTADTCDPAVGCVTVDSPEGTPCSTATVCAGTCAGGECSGGLPIECDDGNPCTSDACDPGSGDCTHDDRPDGAACDDGDACTAGEACTGGDCAGGTATVCDDENACTLDGCAPGTGCAHVAVADGTSCGDGNACNGDESCVAGTCLRGGAPPDCYDDNPCTIDSCNPLTGCTSAAVPAGTICDDDNACTSGETCSGAACAGGTPVVCDDLNQCTIDTCAVGSGCIYLPVAGLPCDDGRETTVDDACASDGTCSGTPAGDELPGCGCRAPGSHGPVPLLLLAGAVVAASLRRRARVKDCRQFADAHAHADAHGSARRARCRSENPPST